MLNRQTDQHRKTDNIPSVGWGGGSNKRILESENFDFGRQGNSVGEVSENMGGGDEKLHNAMQKN